MRIVIQCISALVTALGVGLLVGGGALPQDTPHGQADAALFLGWGAGLLTLGALGILLTVVNALLTRRDADRRPPE